MFELIIESKCMRKRMSLLFEFGSIKKCKSVPVHSYFLYIAVDFVSYEAYT